jgi:hypothetical protein
MQFGQGDLLKNVQGGASDDGSFLALQFTVASGAQLQVVFGEAEVSKILSFIIEQAVAAGAKRPPDASQWRKITAKPVPITQIGVSPGRVDTEAYLAVQAGIFQMTFATQLATLLDALRNLEAITAKRGTPTKPN